MRNECESPFNDRYEWIVVFRNPEQDDPKRWRVYDERGTHHGASLEMSEGKQKHRTWEFRIAKKRTEWTFDD